MNKKESDTKRIMKTARGIMKKYVRVLQALAKDDPSELKRKKK